MTLLYRPTLAASIGNVVHAAVAAHLSFFRSADNLVRFGIDPPVKADKIVRAPITTVVGTRKS